ncbi:MAG: hypothetical protein JSS66_06430 [Armatimonadetes bacterium]|nr:hypothetical protein [Armatimonadota bacterium]
MSLSPQYYNAVQWSPEDECSIAHLATLVEPHLWDMSTLLQATLSPPGQLCSAIELHERIIPTKDPFAFPAREVKAVTVTSSVDWMLPAVELESAVCLDARNSTIQWCGRQTVHNLSQRLKEYVSMTRVFCSGTFVSFEFLGLTFDERSSEFHPLAREFHVVWKVRLCALPQVRENLLDIMLAQSTSITSRVDGN